MVCPTVPTKRSLNICGASRGALHKVRRNPFLSLTRRGISVCARFGFISLQDQGAMVGERRDWDFVCVSQMVGGTSNQTTEDMIPDFNRWLKLAISRQYKSACSNILVIFFFIWKQARTAGEHPGPAQTFEFDGRNDTNARRFAAIKV